MTESKGFKKNASTFGFIANGGKTNNQETIIAKIKPEGNIAKETEVVDDKGLIDSQEIKENLDNTTSSSNNTHTYTHTYTDKIPKRETKSKRLNLLLYPSLYKDIEQLAIMQAISPNELINRLLKEYVTKEESQIMIENYKKITKKK